MRPTVRIVAVQTTCLRRGMKEVFPAEAAPNVTVAIDTKGLRGVPQQPLEFRSVRRVTLKTQPQDERSVRVIVFPGYIFMAGGAQRSGGFSVQEVADVPAVGVVAGIATVRERFVNPIAVHEAVLCMTIATKF